MDQSNIYKIGVMVIIGSQGQLQRVDQVERLVDHVYRLVDQMYRFVDHVYMFLYIYSFSLVLLQCLLLALYRIVLLCFILDNLKIIDQNKD